MEIRNVLSKLCLEAISLVSEAPQRWGKYIQIFRTVDWVLLLPGYDKFLPSLS